LLVSALLPLSLCDAQVLHSRSNRIANTEHSPIQHKEVIERHFESTQPRPYPKFDGAVPGARLLDQRRIRAAKLQNRVHASFAVHPEGGSGSAFMPGIQLRPALPAGSLPTSVVTGDFNQDGHLDFVVANGLDNNLWIYLGKGDGTFQLPRVIPLSKGLSPVGLAVGDLRGNGKLDLVVAEADTSTIGVLLGNGDGTFGFEQEYALPEPPESVVVDDFNHDGKADIAAVMVTTVDPGTLQVPYIALLIGNGSGSFAAPIITNNWGFYSTAWNLASGDVNGDGLPDLLITGPGTENSQIFINNGDGTFKTGATILQNNAISMLLDGRLADVNEDGCLDAVIADASSFVWVAPGDCSGHFATPTAVPMGDSNAAVRLVDVNSDGHLDIVTAALPAINPYLGFLAGNTLSVALGDGKGNFGVARNYVGTSQAYSIGIADFNGDGKPDFVTANNDTDTVTVYQNDGSGGFGFPQGIYAGVLGQLTIDAPKSSLSFADLNNDGKTDVFFLDVGFSGEYYATSLLNDGTGRFTGPISSDTGVAVQNNVVSDYRLGDFRNTGRLDMIAIGVNTAYTSSTQYILFLPGNSDGTFAKGTPLATTGADGLLATGDFNGDGKLDFVTVNGAGTHTLTPFFGNGDGTFRIGTPITFSDNNEEILRVYSGDFNRDGKLDILIFTSGNSYWTPNSAVWEFDGNGNGTFQIGRQLFTGFQPLALADVNGDGHPDIARYDSMWPDGTTETVGPAKFTTYLGQADGSFLESSSYAPYTGLPENVHPYQQSGDPLASSLVADFNGDGKLDEVAFQATGYGTTEKYAQILMGNGDGTLTPTYDVFPFYLYGFPVYAHDLDGDGIADMVELDSGSSELHVLKGARAPALQIALNDAVVTGNSSCGWVFPNLASNSSTAVALSSSVSGVVVPSSVTIPANATSAQFCYTLAANYDWRQVFDINAQLNGDTATAYASESYNLGFSLALSAITPTAIYSSQSTNPITVTLTSSQSYSSKATLYCEGLLPGDSCQFASNTLNVSPAGAATTTVTFVMAANAASYGYSHQFTVVADDGNVIQRQSTTVTVASLRLINLVSPLQSGSPGTATAQMYIFGIPPFTFSCSGLPAGTTCSFSGTQLVYPAESNLTLTIAVPSGTVPGNYPLRVTVTSGPETTSATTILQVLGLSVQGPSASNDWALAGSQQIVAITTNTNIAVSGSISITCTLDVGGTCIGGYAPSSQTPQSVNLYLNVPSGTATGQHVLNVTAAYGTLSQSFSFPFYVADFSGSLSASSVTLTRGGSSSLIATLNATTAFVDSVSLACTGTTQISCSFNPTSTQLTGGTAQTVSITLTASATASAPLMPVQFFDKHLPILAGLFPLAIVWSLRRRRWPALLTIVTGLVLLLPSVSCGSGGNSGGGGGSGGTGGSGSNSYTVTVTASVPNSGVMRMLGTVNVTVNH